MVHRYGQSTEDWETGIKRHRPEETVSKLRQVDVPVGQGKPRIDAIRDVGIVGQTCCRWRKRYGGMGTERLKELKRLGQGNERLRRAVPDLTLDKPILKEAARGNFRALRVVANALALCATSPVSRNARPAVCRASIVPHGVMFHEAAPMRSAWWPA